MHVSKDMEEGLCLINLQKQPSSRDRAARGKELENMDFTKMKEYSF